MTKFCLTLSWVSKGSHGNMQIDSIEYGKEAIRFLKATQGAYYFEIREISTGKLLYTESSRRLV